MKSMYKKCLALSLILFLATFTSCNNDNEKEVENRVYKMSSETSLMYKKEIYTRLDNGQKIRTIIESSFLLDDNTTVNSINKEITYNNASVRIEYYLEDMFLLDINIKKPSYIGKGYPNSGICSSCERDKDGNIKDNTDCSTKGVQQCAYSVYQTWSNAKIVYESLTGGAQEVLKDCILRNCIGW